MTATSPLGRRASGGRGSLARLAIEAPQRCMYASTATGVVELYTWDRTPIPNARRPIGARHVYRCAGPGGEHLWWFPTPTVTVGQLDAPRSRAARPYRRCPASRRRIRPAGNRSGWSWRPLTDAGTTIHLVREGYEFKLYESKHDAFVGRLSRDESLLCLHTPSVAIPGTARCGIVQLEDGTPIGELLGRPGLDSPLRFRADQGRHPAAGQPRKARPPTATDWDPVRRHRGRAVDRSARRCRRRLVPDGYTLLIATTMPPHRAVSVRHHVPRAHQGSTPAGVVSGATARPDGTIEFAWSSSAQPAGDPQPPPARCCCARPRAPRARCRSRTSGSTVPAAGCMR